MLQEIQFRFENARLKRRDYEPVELKGDRTTLFRLIYNIRVIQLYLDMRYHELGFFPIFFFHSIIATDFHLKKKQRY